MAVAMWIRNNMLSTSNQIERQLTEAELKVQRSLQKLSIPDWYLNKRSAPPKILSNATPIESRPSPWKSIPAKKMHDGDPKFYARYPSGTYRISGRVSDSSTGEKLNTDTYRIERRNQTFSHDPDKSSASSINDCTFEVTRPRRFYVSKTFPKVSPSRKIQNINLVFPPSTTKRELSIDREKPDVSLNEALCRTSETETENEEQEATSRVDREDAGQVYKTPTKQRKEREGEEVNDTIVSSSSFSSSEDFRTPLKTPDPRYRFKVRAMSTPQGDSPASLFTSSMVEESVTSRRRLPAWYVRTRNLFEAPAARDVPLARKLAPEMGRVVEQQKRGSDSIVRKEDEGRKVEEVDGVAKPSARVTRRKSLERVSSATRRFFSARNKSTELENIVKSTEEARAGKRLVREIVRALSEKLDLSNASTTSAPCPRGTQSYVRKVVRALECGRELEAREIVEERRKAAARAAAVAEESEGSDSEAKSAACSTTISISDTDSASESDQRSPRSPGSDGSNADGNGNDDGNRFRYDDVVATKRDQQEVHWIPVPRCKMPRTSSLLSMMSRLSTNGQRSPCVSPIRCANDTTQTINTGAWGSTYRKSNGTSANRLFRIDETVVTDSGYSEKSDRSSSAESFAVDDASWTTQTTGYRYVPATMSRKIVY